MAKYRKKPIEIEALRFDGNNFDEIGHFVGFDGRKSGREGRLEIKTREGVMVAKPGDYIIKEPFATTDRKFYPCKPDIFEETYEKID